MHVLYNIFIYLFQAVCRFLSLFNGKINKMYNGGKSAYDSLSKLDKNKKTAWFHCASLGEFEQARNLIEHFKQQNEDYNILLTFFSPSGYEVRKNYKYADCVTYLPADTPKKAKRFIETANPSIVFFIKYEFWWNYIINLKDVPLYSVSLILRENHYLFKPYSKWFIEQLKCFNHLFVQDNNTLSLLNRRGFSNVTLSGDTRFDRVLAMSKEEKDFPLLRQFCSGKKIFLAGSSWPKDEQLIYQTLFQGNQLRFKENNLKLIIAPHLIDGNHIKNLIDIFPKSVRYSMLNEDNVNDYDVVIIDCIGILMYLYSMCFVAYIGGGFGVGIHNVLEAAVFDKPVCFGPNYKKFKEACDLIGQHSAKEIKTPEDLYNWVDKLLKDESFYKDIANKNGQYVINNAGATDKILKTI